MRAKNDWLMSEIKLLHEVYATAGSCAELMAMFPRHTPGSVRRMASSEGLSRPLAGVTKTRPGLERMISLLKEVGPLTSREMGKRLGIKYRAVENLKGMYRENFRIAGWEPPPHMGKWSPKWGLANGLPDALKPFVPKGTKTGGGRKKPNPFAAAAGLAIVPTGQPGRVYQQSMDVDQWQQSRKVAA
jgi:hypothetical protein